MQRGPILPLGEVTQPVIAHAAAAYSAELQHGQAVCWMLKEGGRGKENRAIPTFLDFLPFAGSAFRAAALLLTMKRSLGASQPVRTPWARPLATATLFPALFDPRRDCLRASNGGSEPMQLAGSARSALLQAIGGDRLHFSLERSPLLPPPFVAEPSLFSFLTPAPFSRRTRTLKRFLGTPVPGRPSTFPFARMSLRRGSWPSATPPAPPS